MMRALHGHPTQSRWPSTWVSASRTPQRYWLMPWRHPRHNRPASRDPAIGHRTQAPPPPRPLYQGDFTLEEPQDAIRRFPKKR
ncbi:unnamed protein product [Ixodes pacificus]